MYLNLHAGAVPVQIALNKYNSVDWEKMFELAIDGDKAREYFESTPPADRHTCSMCGKMCAVRTTNMILEGKEVKFVTEK